MVWFESDVGDGGVSDPDWYGGCCHSGDVGGELYSDDSDEVVEYDGGVCRSRICSNGVGNAIFRRCVVGVDFGI